MLRYFQDIGLDIPSSPTAAFQAFPLVDIAMTLLMIPPNLAIQLGSKITIVKLVGVIRICKVISVCFPIGIDIFLQCMEWKYAGPPSKCCAKCFPCCGKGDAPKKKDRVEMKEIKIECVSATEDCGFELTRSFQKGSDEDAATIEDRTSALVDEAKLGEVAGIDADIDALESELQKLAGDQLGERSSAELRELQDAAPGDSRAALALAEEVATLGSEMADSKAESEEQKAEEKKKTEEQKKAEEQKQAEEKTAE